MNAPIPYRRDYAALHAEQQRAWLRVIASHALAAVRNEDPRRILERAWPDDHRASLILKAPTSQMTSADFPAYDPVGVFRSLAPGSAALQLFNAGLRLNMAGVHTLKVPNIAAMPPAPVFVGEGQPAPNVQFSFASTVLGPLKKVLVLSATTSELENGGPDIASGVIGRVLADATTKSVDTIAFDTVAADAVRPAGLLHNVTPITPTAAGADAIHQDLANLVGAIGDAGIDPSGAVYVAGPREAQQIKLHAGPKFDNPVLMTLGLPAKTVACFAPAGILSGYQGQPEIETSKHAAVHLESVSPQNISSTGTPATVSAPTKSAFQLDLLSIRLRANLAYVAMPGAAQVVNTVNW